MKKLRCVIGKHFFKEFNYGSYTIKKCQDEDCRHVKTKFVEVKK